MCVIIQLGSPMGGVVEKVPVKVGDAVKAGDVVCVVSAMKMEVKVSAPCDGVVASIAVPNIGTCMLLLLLSLL
jgi:biotin carboxyl carrier protein